MVDDADVKGPFTKVIPRDLEKQASLPALAYRSALERLGERFHVAPALLQRMNPHVTFTKGTEIQVPAVTPFDVDAKPPAEPLEPDVTVQVTREDSALRVPRPDGTVVFFAPVTSGSEHDPLPLGDWKVTSVDWHPRVPLQPGSLLGREAEALESRRSSAARTIRSASSGSTSTWNTTACTARPSRRRIGHTESHGCVRLTNWDAARVAALVKPGTPVLFR